MKNKSDTSNEYYSLKNRSIWQNSSGNWKWHVSRKMRRFLEEQWAEERDQQAIAWKKRHEEDRIKAKDRFIRENPHIALLEEVSGEEGLELAFQFLDIYVQRDKAIRQAKEKAFEAKRKLFQKMTNRELPLDRIDSTESFSLAQKAYKGTLRSLVELYLSNPDHCSPEAEVCLSNKLIEFSEIEKLDDLAIQRVLREVDIYHLGRALLQANWEICDLVFRNMSRRAAELLKEDMDFMGPLKRYQIKESQDVVAETIQQLVDNGEIEIPTDDSSVVL